MLVRLAMCSVMSVSSEVCVAQRSPTEYYPRRIWAGSWMVRSTSQVCMAVMQPVVCISCVSVRFTTICALVSRFCHTQRATSGSASGPGGLDVSPITTSSIPLLSRMLMIRIFQVFQLPSLSFSCFWRAKTGDWI